VKARNTRASRVSVAMTLSGDAEGSAHLLTM
jgi:hypothetical protein